MNDSLSVQIIRSSKRKRTISAKVRGNEILVYLPAGLSEKEEKKWVDKMVSRVESHTKRGSLVDHNKELIKRADQLNRLYLSGKARWNSIEYVSNQNKIFGSCASREGSIRLSERLLKMPDWVRDYVIIHELAHLIHPNHSKPFWGIVNQYRLTERARGYLMASSLDSDETGL